MRILMVNKFLHPNGGSETYIFKIGEYLNANGHEVQFFGMEHEGRIVGNHAESYTSDMDFHTGKLQKLLYPFRILYSFEARKKIRAVLEDFNPEVVHLNNFNFQLTPSILYEVKKFARIRKMKLPIIYTAHDSQLVCPNHLMLRPPNQEKCYRCKGGRFIQCVIGRCIHQSLVKSILGSLEGYLYQILKTYKHLDSIICPSQFMENRLQKCKILSNKTVVLHNFVEESYREQVNTFHLEEKEDYVLYFGRYSKEKGVLELLEVCKQLPDVKFIFAGNGPLDEQVNKVKNVKNVGFQSGKDLVKLIQKARFALVVSICYENCPFSVMEAQMYQTPVIASNLGGIPELLQNGKTGLLFESGNLSDLKEKIEFLWKHVEISKELSVNCKQAKFDTLEIYCTKLMKIYRQEE